MLPLLWNKYSGWRGLFFTKNFKNNTAKRTISKATRVKIQNYCHLSLVVKYKSQLSEAIFQNVGDKQHKLRALLNCNKVPSTNMKKYTGRELRPLREFLQFRYSYNTVITDYIEFREKPRLGSENYSVSSPLRA